MAWWYKPWFIPVGDMDGVLEGVALGERVGVEVVGEVLGFDVVGEVLGFEVVGEVLGFEVVGDLDGLEVLGAYDGESEVGVFVAGDATGFLEGDAVGLSDVVGAELQSAEAVVDP